VTAQCLACALPLPANFRVGDILAFHRRDPQEIAECVTNDSLRKGLLWRGVPASLSIRFGRGEAQAELAIEGTAGRGAQAAFEAMLARMLGLGQAVETFERRFRRHPQLGPLLARQRGLRVPVAATPFEALSWAVTGQQISVAAAVSIRRKLIAAVGLRHSGGLLCTPEAPQIASLSEATLRRAGFSGTKTTTLLSLAHLVAEGELPLDAWMKTLPVDTIRERLGAVRGIGPWTIDYALLRGYGWLDGSLHGDAAVRRGMQRLLGAEERIGEAQAKTWLAEFAPWRALVAAHLWALQRTAA